MLEISPKKLELKKFLTWTGLIIIVLTAGIFLINRKISAVTLGLQDKKSQVQALKNREENISRLQENYYQIESDISTVTNILPDDANIAFFVKYLEELAAKHDVNTKLVFDDKINTNIEENKYLAFDLTVSGSGFGTQQYWQDLENGPYFINVTSFNLKTASGLGSDSQLKLTCKVFTNVPYKTN